MQIDSNVKIIRLNIDGLYPINLINCFTHIYVTITFTTSLNAYNEMEIFAY